MRGSIARASARVSETRRDADADVDARSDGCEEIENRATEPYVVYGARDAERDRFARRARGELERAPAPRRQRDGAFLHHHRARARSEQTLESSRRANNVSQDS